MASSAPIVVVAGVGNATGTGAAVARAFAGTLKYRVALIARRQKDVDEIAKQIQQAGGEAKGFEVKQYNHDCIHQVFKDIKSTWKESRIKSCVWNASQWSMIPFLDVRKEDIEKSTQINIVAAFAFAQEAVKAMLPPSWKPDQVTTTITKPCDPAYATSPGGSILITGATSGTRGAANFSTFAAGKHGLRALSQSLAREFGKHGIHVAQCRSRWSVSSVESGQHWIEDESKHLDPNVIAKTYLFLHQQEPSVWSAELDLRPAKEHF